MGDRMETLLNQVDEKGRPSGLRWRLGKAPPAAGSAAVIRVGHWVWELADEKGERVAAFLLVAKRLPATGHEWRVVGRDGRSLRFGWLHGNDETEALRQAGLAAALVAGWEGARAQALAEHARQVLYWAFLCEPDLLDGWVEREEVDEPSSDE